MDDLTKFIEDAQQALTAFNEAVSYRDGVDQYNWTEMCEQLAQGTGTLTPEEALIQAKKIIIADYTFLRLDCLPGGASGGLDEDTNIDSPTQVEDMGKEEVVQRLRKLFGIAEINGVEEVVQKIMMAN
jgi:hypothetical protein